LIEIETDKILLLVLLL